MRRCNWTTRVVALAGGLAALGCQTAPVDRICTVHIALRPASDPLLAGADALHLVVSRAGSTLFEDDLDLAQTGAGHQLEVVDPTTGQPLQVDSGPDFSLALTFFARASATAQAVGRSLRFGCSGTDDVTVPIYLGPANGFAAVSGTTAARLGATASALADGRVLVVGGQVAAGAAADPTVLVYDQRSGTWCGTECVSGDLPAARIEHSATTLADGSILIVGGRRPGTQQLLADAVLFDPASNRFRTLPLALGARARHTATLLGGGNVPADLRGRVVIAGGVGGGSTPLADGLYLDVAAATTVPLEQQMSTPRADASATLLPSGEVLFAGGRGDNGALLETVDLFRTSERAFDSAVASFSHLQAKRASHTASALDDGSVLLWGGDVAPPAATSSAQPAEVFSATLLRALPIEALAISATVGHTAARVDCGAAPCPTLIAGGETEAGIAAVPTLFWPATVNSGTAYQGTLQALPVAGAAARRRHAAAALPDGSVLLVGGQDSAGRELTQAAIFSPCQPTAAIACP